MPARKTVDLTPFRRYADTHVPEATEALLEGLTGRPDGGANLNHFYGGWLIGQHIGLLPDVGDWEIRPFAEGLVGPSSKTLLQLDVWVGDRHKKHAAVQTTRRYEDPSTGTRISVKTGDVFEEVWEGRQYDRQKDMVLPVVQLGRSVAPVKNPSANTVGRYVLGDKTLLPVYAKPVERTITKVRADVERAVRAGKLVKPSVKR